MGTVNSTQEISEPAQTLTYEPTEQQNLPNIKTEIVTESPAPTNKFVSQEQETEPKYTVQPEFAPEDDGFRWRKYGQKSVKGNQFPRSYYKCTHPDCTVKKQVETIMDNNEPVIHTTYKGEHNHQPPQVTRIKVDDQVTFKTSVISEFMGAEEGLESLRTTNPRLVIEAPLEVDFLDDGYNWRKYGQKNVKGSAHPRSYYKCTDTNCSVKKQVERCENTTITYEGMHNHMAPGLDPQRRRRRRRRAPSPKSSKSAKKRKIEEEGTSNYTDLAPLSFLSPTQYALGGVPYSMPLISNTFTSLGQIKDTDGADIMASLQGQQHLNDLPTPVLAQQVPEVLSNMMTIDQRQTSGAQGFSPLHKTNTSFNDYLPLSAQSVFCSPSASDLFSVATTMSDFTSNCSLDSIIPQQS
eukprot:CAMPEP_0174260512 /NCGR_PEP_ID=MMETSP0439-20130205/9803_1 /TAXON_ID=0 /ORGANISM="Stereomyxa ramosa, Strain Chinc5" /LENGTH=408 /DNA_ID=CAMNT_0015344769 /DNA_START=28 /DNA_END=1254 /DNA_ORIENTATION=-